MARRPASNTASVAATQRDGSQNIYFASAMFGKPIRYVAAAVLPAAAAIFIGSLLIALLPVLSTGLPRWLAGS